MRYLLLVAALGQLAEAAQEIAGTLTDPQDKAVAGAVIRVAGRQTRSGADGRYRITGLAPGNYEISYYAAGFQPVQRSNTLLPGHLANISIKFTALAAQAETLPVNGQSLEPSIDLRNAEVFNHIRRLRNDLHLDRFDRPEILV